MDRKTFLKFLGLGGLAATVPTVAATPPLLPKPETGYWKTLPDQNGLIVAKCWVENDYRVGGEIAPYVKGCRAFIQSITYRWTGPRSPELQEKTPGKLEWVETKATKRDHINTLGDVAAISYAFWTVTRRERWLDDSTREIVTHEYAGTQAGLYE